MNPVLSGLIVYVFLWVVFRIAGKRTLADATTFDLLLLLIISECIQNALVDSDNSLTHAGLLVVTLVGLDIALSHLSLCSKKWDALLNSQPVIVIANGEVLPRKMKICRLQIEDILSAARATQGLYKLEQIKFAIMEQNGQISIIPKENT